MRFMKHKKIVSVALIAAILVSGATNLIYPVTAQTDSDIEISTDVSTEVAADEDIMVESEDSEVTAEEDTDEISIHEVDNLADFYEEVTELNKDTDLDSESSYATKRLLVTSGNSESNTYDAVSVISYGNLYVLTYDTEAATKAAYKSLKNDTSIQSVEIDKIMETEANDDASDDITIVSENDIVVSDENDVVSDDVTVTQDTELKKYLDSLQSSQEVKVAILDTGIDTSKFNNIIDLGINLSSSGEQDSIKDDNGHGTEMAEIIMKNNSNDYVKLMPIKVANAEGKATVLNTYLGIQQAIENDADIINISMTAAKSASSEILTAIIDEATEKGIVVVVSAGNLGVDASKVSPANVDSAIVVSAVSNANEFAEYSNYGDSVDYSSYGSYNGKNGTSYAAANVAGIIADVLSKQGSVELLDEYAIDLGSEGGDNQFGKGLVALGMVTADDKEDETESSYHTENYYTLRDNWKNLSDTELEDILQNTHQYEIGSFLCGLSSEDYSEVYNKSELLQSENVTYVNNENGETVVDKVQSYADYCKSFFTDYLKVQYESESLGSWAKTSGYYHYIFSTATSTKIKVSVELAATCKVNTQATVTKVSIASGAKYGLTVDSFNGKLYTTSDYTTDMEQSGAGSPNYIYLKATYSFTMPSGYHHLSSITKDNGAFCHWGSKITNKTKAVFNVHQSIKSTGIYDTDNHVEGTNNHVVFKLTLVPYRTVTYKPNGGTGSDYKVTVVEGDNHKVLKPTNDNLKYTRTGYTFAGWEDADGNPWEPDEKIEDITWDYVLKAQWEPNVYEITLDNQGATTAGTGAYYELYADDNYKENACINAITKIETAPTKNNYTFGGYWTEKDGKGTQYVKPDRTITSKATTFTSNTTLYAYWIPNVYTITLDNQGADANSQGTKAYYEKYDVDNYKEIGCTNTIKNITVPKKTDYTFGGYYTKNANGTYGTQYVRPDGTITSTPTTFTANITLFAKWIPTGKINLTKTSLYPDMTTDNDCYELNGAVYTLYTDAACTQSTGKTITTDASGKGSIKGLALGTYYVKETTAPKGFELDTKVYTATCTETANEVNINSVETPSNDPMSITVTKSWNGEATDTVASLEGTQFTIKYYDGYYNTANEVTGLTPVRTWVIEVKYNSNIDKYMTLLGDDYLVDDLSDELYKDSAGAACLPLGTITVQETKAAPGYTLEGEFKDGNGNVISPDELYVSQIKDSTSGVKLEGGNAFTAADDPQPCNIKLSKKDASGNPLQGVEFTIKDSEGNEVKDMNGATLGTAKTNASGIVEFKNLYPDVYTITEVKTVTGYQLLKEPITVYAPLRMTQAEATANNLDTTKAVWNESENCYLIFDQTFEVSNTVTFTMPMSGGTFDSKMLIPLGVGMVVLAGAFIVMFRKKKKQA